MVIESFCLTILACWLLRLTGLFSPGISIKEFKIIRMWVAFGITQLHWDGPCSYNQQWRADITINKLLAFSRFFHWTFYSILSWRQLSHIKTSHINTANSLQILQIERITHQLCQTHCIGSLVCFHQPFNRLLRLILY